MSLYRVLTRDTGWLAEVGYSAHMGGYWRVVYDAQTEDVVLDVEVFGGLVDLLTATRGVVDWDHEASVVRRLHHDPVVEALAASEDPAVAGLISQSLDVVVRAS